MRFDSIVRVHRRWVDLPFLNLRISWFAVALALLVLAALAPRLQDRDFGLPYLHYWDEPFVMGPALRVLHDNDLNPHFWKWPTLCHYLHAAQGYLSLLGAMTRGEIENIYAIRSGDDTLYVWDCPYPFFYENGRKLTAVFGAATVLLAGLISRRIAGPLAGIASAALLAGYSNHVVYSHYVTVEVPMVFFVFLAVWGSLGMFARRPSVGRYVAVGFLCGLPAAAKYNMYPVAVVPLCVHLLNPRRGRFWTLPVLALTAGIPLGFLAGCPMALSDPLAFLHETSSQFARFLTVERGVGVVVAGRQALGKYLNEAWQGGRGAAILLFALAGFIPVRRFGWRKILPVWALCIAYVALMMRQTVYYPRYSLPFLSLLLLPAGCGIAAVARILGARRRLSALLAAAFLTVCVAPQIGPYRRAVADFRRPDSRLEMARWIDASVKNGATIAVARELHFASGTLDPRFRQVDFNHLGTTWGRVKETGAEYLLTSDNYAFQKPDGREDLLRDYNARFAGTDLVKSIGNTPFYLDRVNDFGNVVLRRLPQGDTPDVQPVAGPAFSALKMNPTRAVGISDAGGVAFLEPGSLVMQIRLSSPASRVVLKSRRGYIRERTNPGSGVFTVYLMNAADTSQVIASKPVEVFDDYSVEYRVPLEVPAGVYLMQIRYEAKRNRVAAELEWVRFE